jgi:hypothetical protein
MLLEIVRVFCLAWVVGTAVIVVVIARTWPQAPKDTDLWPGGSEDHGNRSSVENN